MWKSNKPIQLGQVKLGYGLKQINKNQLAPRY